MSVRTAAAAAKNVFIVAAKRTPFGSFGGSLKSLSAADLGVISTTSALDSQPNLDPSMVDATFFGNCIQSSPDALYIARHVALRCGVPQSTPALTVNRLCGSGFESVVQGYNLMRLGESRVAVCGGAENMSASPLVVDGNAVRWGVGLGKGLSVRDALWDGLTDSYCDTPMGMTAENLAEKYNISREECDEYAIRSQTLWGAAKRSGVFDLETAPVEIKNRKGETETVDTDEHPRPETTKDKISKLKPVFKKDGVVTAANASGICDGAGTIILATEDACAEHDLKPLARIMSCHVSGCDPAIMGIGPVSAIRGALDRAGLGLGDADRIEVNEAFAAQLLACAKELDLDMTKTNSNGGAISLGHPLAASGSRILAHLANEYERTEDENEKVFVGSACIGGGQGIAVVLERA